MMARKNAMQQYQQVNLHSMVEGASPHRLTQMLLDGYLQRVAEAKGAIDRSDSAMKGLAIGKAVAILGELQSSLDADNGGEVAENLASLYDYIQRCLMDANIHNDVAKLDEASDLIRPVKEAWDQISD